MNYIQRKAAAYQIFPLTALAPWCLGVKAHNLRRPWYC